mmetsp:Transcript_139871/g.447334  ORF Transcript_139871/g.447334 Transcript_139871/m.447334 type:complete len:132 (+) Transcript_139871:1350-1745(+)
MFTGVSVGPSFQMHLTGCRQVLLCEAVLVAVGGLFLVSLRLTGVATAWAAESDLALALFIAADCVAVLVLVLLGRRKTRALAVANLASAAASTTEDWAEPPLPDEAVASSVLANSVAARDVVVENHGKTSL